MSSLLSKSGTLQYPATELVTLARLILMQYESYLQAKRDAYRLESVVDRSSCDAGLIMEDIWDLYYLVDRPRYVEREELLREEKLHPSVRSGIDDPKQPERALLHVGIKQKANYLFVDAVKFRKETRGQPSNDGNWDSEKETRGQPSNDGNWDSEDALLDFLVFLSHPEHKDLFTVDS
ncbi:hypothetical protein M413DRAFT_9178 [Hebeloma cylindrosporum]|uniref:Uncharacterized protein n=1 Tax=Hebeloma cylindrosporum TaxID=76867 RepID=A0A0C3CMG5_HEBCY|nr:hypothetical protein M413DRAFT_9178 [Hebeloma cylindrosporum h7]